MATFHTNDGVTLSYTDSAPDGSDPARRDARPVVLIHGYTAPAAAWALLIDDETPKMITTDDWPYSCYDYCGHTVAIDQPDRLVDEPAALLRDTEPAA